MMKGATLIIMLFIGSVSADAQSIFDKAEHWLKEHHATISYGPQYSWYKYSHIRIVQPELKRDAELMYVHGRQTDNSAALKRGEITTAQSKISLTIELSKNYAIQLYTTHLNYEVINTNDYHLRGVWDGNTIAETITTRNYINQLEHTNGLNFWSVGVKRNISLLEKDNLGIHVGLMPNIGSVFTATQAQIYTPAGDLAYYDPGNKISGFMIGGEVSLNTVLYKHWVLAGNYIFFQTYIKKAQLDHESYIAQRLRGSHYGVSLGYRL